MSESPEWIEKTSNGIFLHVLIQPKASKTEIVGPHGAPARLKIRVAAPPVEGEANEELIRYLKKKTGVPASHIQIVRGETSKMKTLFLAGISSEDASKVLI